MTGKLSELLDSPEWQQLQVDIAAAKEKQEARINAKWEAMSPDDQQDMFYAVVQRIVEGELVDKGSYRYVLYDTFGWGPEAYWMGMDCGFMELHNSIDAGD